MNWPHGNGEMAALIRTHDWAGTPLGATDTWPDRLKAVVELVLASPLVSTVALLDDRLLIYNDAAARLYGDRHPGALGCPLGKVFADSYRAVAPLYDRVFAGEAVQIASQPVAVSAAEGREIFDAYLSPVRDAAGTVIGAHMVGLEVGTRLRAAAALRDSETRFRAFVTASADVVYRMNPDWSEMRQLEGRNFLRDTSEPTADWLDNYIDPDDQIEVRAAIDLAIRTKSMFELEHRVIRADGTLGYTLSRAVPILDDRGAIREWLGAASDVTAARLVEVARRSAQAASRKAEARYLALFNTIDQGFCTIEVAFDRQARATDYRFIEVSPSFEEQTGIANAAGRWMRTIAPDHDQHWFDVYGHVARTGESARFEDYSTPLNRWWEVFAFRIEDPAQHTVGILFRDITDRKRAAAASREREERQAFLLQLTDALGPIEKAADIERTAADLLGKKLGVNRAFYATIERDGDTAVVRHTFVDGVESGVGRHSLSAFSPGRVREWRAGRATMTVDTETDPTFGDSERAGYASVSARAAVGVPLVKGGRLVAMLAVNQSTPRVWTAHECGLIADVAERTWMAVERAHAEAALHETEAMLQQFGEASQDVLWIRDADTFQWEYLSPAFETIYGLSRDAALRGDNMAGWLALVVPEDRDHAARSIERVRKGDRVTFQYRIRRPVDGGVRWLRDTDFPIHDASGKVVRIGGTGHDITALKETERALADAEKRQRALLEGIPQLVWRGVDGGKWTWASPQWTEYTGQTQADSCDYGWLDVVHPDERRSVLDVWNEAIARGEFRADYRIRHRETGRYRWFQTRATPVRDDDGAIVEWLGTSTDVDDLRSLQERQQVLLAELQHRVRNILAIIRSIMRRSLNGEQSLQDYAQHLEGRVAALARTQVLLTRHPNANVGLEELIRDELTAQAADHARTVIDGPDVDLPPKAAEVLALAMHELATNSVKFGAIAHPDAGLRIEWRVEDRAEGRELTLVWTETGVPVAAPDMRRDGFGTELITRRVPYELKGRGDLAIRPGGIVCTISFPLTEGASILETGSAAETYGDAI